jgi:GTPase SAR1 family protein
MFKAYVEVGQERFKAMMRSYFVDASALILAFDLSRFKFVFSCQIKLQTIILS